MNKGNQIVRIEENSPAEKADVRVGDMLVSVNGEQIEDIFDYRYSILNSTLEMKLERDKENISETNTDANKATGKEIVTVTLTKEEDEDPGLEFESGLMDDYRRCKNNCIFCFIDQMPKGMRETLYFKDDDSRLSFLQGNYVTLTNMSNHDVERIIRFKMEPINISFQTTNPELRCKMLNNRFAGDALKIADRFYDAGITMNGQIVLCKGINDGDELERSIQDLVKYAPVLESVSVVPVGLSKYREGLFPLKPFTKEDAIQVIDCIERHQREVYEKFGIHFIHASDEWYILAGRELPEEERYDGYLQLENGVGMVRLLKSEFYEAMEEMAVTGLKKKLMHKNYVTIVTGRLAFPIMKEFADRVMNEYPRVQIDVVAIRNDFFGERITVSGLLTGQDIVKQLSEVKHAKTLLLPENVLRSGEDVFLDDMTLGELENALQVSAVIVKSSGCELFENMLYAGL